MKNQFNLIYLFTLTFLLTTQSCSDDDEASVNELTLQGFAATIDENPTNGQTLGKIDADGDGALSYSITSQSPAEALTLNSGSGELTVADATLFDFEINPEITAIVSVSNSTTTETTTVTISLNDMNEIGVQNFIVAIDENPVNAQSVGSIQVTGNGSASFSIESQTPVGALSIDATTGELTVADATLFDFETNPIISGNVTVTDAESAATFTINLNNLVEISADDLTVTIDENPIDGQTVGTIQVNGGGNLSYSITSQTPAAALNINTSTGELTVADPTLFDFETNSVITAIISVDDVADATTATATINLTDVDEVTAQDLNADLDENPTNGEVVGSIQASSIGALTYTITYQSTAGALSIDQSTGELSVADETLFDFETNPNMLATISVDNGISSVSANAFVDLNDVAEIGEFKYGGVIFWIDPSSNNSSGLVCAITDQGTNISWGCQGTTLSGTSTAIGTGAANTAAIIAGCPTPGIAADVAANATIQGLSDWFLPSIDELNEIYLNRAVINATASANGGNAFNTTIFASFYFSSTEVAATAANIIDFSNGTQQNGSKNPAVFSVRAVRAWTNF